MTCTAASWLSSMLVHPGTRNTTHAPHKPATTLVLLLLFIMCVTAMDCNHHHHNHHHCNHNPSPARATLTPHTAMIFGHGEKDSPERRWSSGRDEERRGMACMHREICDRSYVTCSMSHATRHTSHVTHHTSHVTHPSSNGGGRQTANAKVGIPARASHVTRYTSHVTRH